MRQVVYSVPLKNESSQLKATITRLNHNSRQHIFFN